jgi:SpoIID/LytB domain protein
VPTGVHDQAVTAAARATFWTLLGGIIALADGAIGPTIVRAQPGPAYFIRSLQNPAERHEVRPDVLDAPVLAGSVMKALTLVAALESQVIEPDSTRLCRKVITVDGRRYVCAHPDLKRPLTAAEALAHSCNDFFVSLAPRLPRTAVNGLRGRLGLPPLSESANLAAALVGLDGPRISPRALLDVIARLAGVDHQRPLSMSDSVRRVLLEGLRGAGQYGSAQPLAARRVVALAKTGTAPMPGGSWMGLVVAFEPADKPTRAIVVVAPGAGGLDAAAIAGDLLTGNMLVNRAVSPARAPAAGRAGEAPLPLNPPAKVSTILRIGTTANGRVLRLDLEDYIARVVAAEGEPNASAAAQQALAITARTFALANLQRHRRENYDLCDTTHCQVLRASTPATRRAAQATAERVLMHQGQPASVFYSASCGGHSELASQVWPGALDYAATSQPDDACREEPRWDSEIRAGDIERALRAAGHRGDRLRGLRVIERNASNRVAKLRADGFTPAEISGHDFRIAVARVAGWQRMKSTAFDVRRTGAGYRFTGRGFGHGVGLCVIGAGQRGLAGASARQILEFYFPNLRIETYRGASRLTAKPELLPVPAPPASADPRPADVLVALPATEETDRKLVVQMIRSARDQIAAKASVTPPASIRVTVHSNVEAFGRATGQPWWVSGATDGAAIDLLPVTMLRQQGQLERTIRHEVAHALLDASLTARSLWVREGAALYFAESAAESPPSLIVPGLPGRTACPADAEFLRPLSAGAHRSAYARAEACFRRALAGGKRWQDVR